MILLCGFVLWFIVLYLIAFYQSRNKRQETAKENVQRNNGRRKLEWSLPLAEGAADGEYGALIVELPNKIAGNPVKFYEYGLIVSNKRVSYMELKDVLAVVSDKEKHHTLKDAVRDSAKLFLYRNTGPTINLQSFQYYLDNDVIKAIQEGLGY